ncbi:hypothetical protein J6590_054782 [Homalodisca vitripennis]|nr:hypothetical protein J6590_054782 [Homalodisca vitripennis]
MVPAEFYSPAVGQSAIRVTGAGPIKSSFKQDHKWFSVHKDTRTNKTVVVKPQENPDHDRVGLVALVCKQVKPTQLHHFLDKVLVQSLSPLRNIVYNKYFTGIVQKHNLQHHQRCLRKQSTVKNPIKDTTKSNQNEETPQNHNTRGALSQTQRDYVSVQQTERVDSASTLLEEWPLNKLQRHEAAPLSTAKYFLPARPIAESCFFSPSVFLPSPTQTSISGSVVIVISFLLRQPVPLSARPPSTSPPPQFITSRSLIVRRYYLRCCHAAEPLHGEPLPITCIMFKFSVIDSHASRFCIEDRVFFNWLLGPPRSLRSPRLQHCPSRLTSTVTSPLRLGWDNYWGRLSYSPIQCT